MDQLYAEESLLQVALVTGVLGGGAAEGARSELQWSQNSWSLVDWPQVGHVTTMKNDPDFDPRSAARFRAASS